MGRIVCWGCQQPKEDNSPWFVVEYKPYIEIRLCRRCAAVHKARQIKAALNDEMSDDVPECEQKFKDYRP